MSKDVDWEAVRAASRLGRLMEVLQTVPRALWHERCGQGNSLLHYAAQGDNVAAACVLIQHGVDASPLNRALFTAAHWACYFKESRVLEALCAAPGALVHHKLLLDVALFKQHDRGVALLLANGVRLRTVSSVRTLCVVPWMVALERGVLRCRSVVMVLLGLKRRRVMLEMDRFLLREICVQLWATRSDKEWQVS